MPYLLGNSTADRMLVDALPVMLLGWLNMYVSLLRCVLLLLLLQALWQVK